MDAGYPVPDHSDPAGPCSCGSALPRALCCGARLLAGGEGPAVFAETEPTDAAADEWDLAITTVHALAPVLPDVPVPLWRNRTPRALYQAGPEERAAAVGFVQAVARSAEKMGLDLPLDRTLELLASPEAPAYPREDRERITLAGFTLHLLARGVEPAAVLGGQRLFRDLLRTAGPDLDDPLTHAAAVDYAVCWMHFRPEVGDGHPEGQRQIASLYGVEPEAVAEHFAAMKHALKLVWFDPRYAVQDAAWQERLEATARAIAEGREIEETQP